MQERHHEEVNNSTYASIVYFVCVCNFLVSSLKGVDLQGRRGSRGRYRGRSRNRGTDRGYAQGNRPKEYTNNNTQNNNNQSSAPKGVRGRGPRRYQPSFKKNNEAPITQNKQ